jgi:hypothetical protein
MLGPMAEPQQPAVIGEQVFRMKARQLPSEDEAKAILEDAQASAEVTRLHREGFEELVLASVGRGLFADANGNLWRRQHGEPRDGRRPLDHGFVIAGDGRPAWFSRPEFGQIRTASELEARDKQRAEAVAEQTKTREALLAASAKKASRVLTYRDLRGGVGPGSLAEAAEAIRAEGGRLDVANGRLFVVMPTRDPITDSFRVDDGRATGAARLLYAAEEVVVGCLTGKKPLPDAELTPAGALIPAKYRNHRRAEP